MNAKPRLEENRTASKASGGDDNSDTESVTTEQSSGYGSALGKPSDNSDFKTDLDDMRVAFGSDYPAEVNEDDYVSPMRLSEEENGGVVEHDDDDDEGTDSGREDSATSESRQRMLKAKIASYGMNDSVSIYSTPKYCL